MWKLSRNIYVQEVLQIGYLVYHADIHNSLPPEFNG
jgi:hypothetical protein